MKWRFLILATLLLSVTTKLIAQSKATPAPEFMNEIYYYDKSGNTLNKLEKVKASIKTGVKAFKPAETSFEVNGDKSGFRLPAQDNTSFIVSLSEASGDPSGWFALYKADIKKGKRIAVWVKTGLMTGKSSDGDNLITYNVKKPNDKTFEIIPGTKLEKGEYFFVAKGTAINYGGQAYDVFAFGID